MTRLIDEFDRIVRTQHRYKIKEALEKGWPLFRITAKYRCTNKQVYEVAAAEGLTVSNPDDEGRQ